MLNLIASELRLVHERNVENLKVLQPPALKNKVWTGDASIQERNLANIQVYIALKVSSNTCIRNWYCWRWDGDLKRGSSHLLSDLPVPAAWLTSALSLTCWSWSLGGVEPLTCWRRRCCCRRRRCWRVETPPPLPVTRPRRRRYRTGGIGNEGMSWLLMRWADLRLGESELEWSGPMPDGLGARYYFFRYILQKIEKYLWSIKLINHLIVKKFLHQFFF